MLLLVECLTMWVFRPVFPTVQPVNSRVLIVLSVWIQVSAHCLHVACMYGMFLANYFDDSVDRCDAAMTLSVLRIRILEPTGQRMYLLGILGEIFAESNEPAHKTRLLCVCEHRIEDQLHEQSSTQVENLFAAASSVLLQLAVCASSTLLKKCAAAHCVQTVPRQTPSVGSLIYYFSSNNTLWRQFSYQRDISL